MDENERQEKLNELFATTVNKLLEDLNDPNSRNGGLYNAAIRLLHDNQVEALPTPGSALADLENLPFPKAASVG